MSNPQADFIKAATRQFVLIHTKTAEDPSLMRGLGEIGRWGFHQAKKYPGYVMKHPVNALFTAAGTAAPIAAAYSASRKPDEADPVHPVGEEYLPLITALGGRRGLINSLMGR